MKKYDLSQTFKDLNGNEIKQPSDALGVPGQPLKFGQALANTLLGDRTKKLDAFKLYSLGVKVYECAAETEIDDAEAAKIKEILQVSDVYPPIVMGPLLGLFL